MVDSEHIVEVVFKANGGLRAHVAYTTRKEKAPSNGFAVHLEHRELASTMNCATTMERIYLMLCVKMNRWNEPPAEAMSRSQQTKKRKRAKTAGSLSRV